MSTCSNCGEWENSKEDIWCSWCGHRLVSIRARLSQAAYTLDQLLPPRANLQLLNESHSSAISVHEVEASEPWIKVEWGNQPRPLLLAPREKADFKCRVRTVDLPPNSYNRGYIVVHSDVGLDRVAVDVTPPRRIEVSGNYDGLLRTPCEYDVVLDNRPLERNILRVRVVEGIGTLTGVSTDDPDIVSIRLLGQTRLPLTLDARQQEGCFLDIQMDLDEQRLLLQGTACPAARKAGIIVQFGADSHREEVTFRLWRPPGLRIPEEADYATRVASGRTGRVTLTLQNRDAFVGRDSIGNAPLKVTGVECSVRGRSSAAPFLRAARSIEFPLVINGGGEVKLEYDIQTADAADSGDGPLGLGTWELTFDIATDYSPAARKVHLEVSVERVPDFDGILAIDFGTSNSCVACFRDSDRKRALIPVQGGTTTPTVVQYLAPALELSLARVRIGNDVATNIFTHKHLRSVVHSPKLKLGRSNGEGHFDVAYYDTQDVGHLLAREVVSDYLRVLRDTAEQHENARFREIWFTHPCAFEPAQIQDLREAILDAFGQDCGIFPLAEPVAAALGHMLKPEMLDLDRYWLAVFDFGGGTTDLSLLEVENRKVGDRTELVPRQRHFSGHVFGGGDVTGFIADRVWARCLDFVRADSPGDLLTRDGASRDPDLRQLGLMNDSIVLAWAEDLKVHSLFGGAEMANPQLSLHIKVADGKFTVRDFPTREMVQAAQEVKPWLAERVSAIAGDIALMATDVGIDAPGFILLSGKSSKIPLVADVLRSKFPSSSLCLSDEPKQCVVEGACVPYILGAAEDVVLRGMEGSGFVRTTARIGLETPQAGAGKFGFHEIFDQGVEVPAGGLEFVRRNYPLQRVSRVILSQNANTVRDDLDNQANIRRLGIWVPDPSVVPLPHGHVLDVDLVVRLSPSLELTVTATDASGRVIPFRKKQATAQGA